MNCRAAEKPIQVEKHCGVSLYKCPGCGYWIGSKANAIKQGFLFCPECDLPLNWKEVK